MSAGIRVQTLSDCSKLILTLYHIDMHNSREKAAQTSLLSSDAEKWSRVADRLLTDRLF